MQRYALKFGYDGRGFLGYQRQPEARTVEGDIIAAMLSTKIISDFKNAGFQSASRTDKGVSALGNVLSVNTEFRRGEIIPALNASLSGIWFYGISDMPDSFMPRHANKRRYVYYLPAEGRDLAALKKASRYFIGQHDFWNFCYNVKGKDPVRIVSKIEIRKSGRYVTVEMEAPSFLWGMVRKVVAAILKVESGEKALSDIRDTLEGGKRCDFGVAPPEFLVLSDVCYDFEFDIAGKTKNRKSGKTIDDITERIYKSDTKSIFFREMLRRFG